MPDSPRMTGPVDLRVERVNAPIAVDDAAPLLSWRLPDAETGQRQTAYRIKFVDRGAASWDPTDENVCLTFDSGEIESSECIDIPYSGAPLESARVYFWAVGVVTEDWRRVDDSSNKNLWKWSAPVSFETALLSEPLGEWIGAPDGTVGVDLDRAGPEQNIQRLWTTDGHVRCCFRATFDLPVGRPITEARLDFGSTLTTAAWINGSRIEVGDTGALIGALQPGRNVLAVDAAATGAHPGLLAALTVSPWRQDRPALVSDGRWRVATDPAPEWTEPAFDDSQWALADEVGVHGVPPLGRDAVSHHPADYLRRRVDVKSPVVRARLRATAVGLYQVSINGIPAGPDRLTPGWVDIRSRMPFQTFDVTTAFNLGRNTVEAVLADGWSLGNICWFGRHQYASRRSFSAHLELTLADGTEQIIRTDAAWEWAQGAIRYADLQNGETVDARLSGERRELSGLRWSAAATVPVAVGPLEAQVSPPITVTQELPAVAVHRRGRDRFIVDFGQNLVGWVRLALRVESDRKVLLRFAEVLDADGELYTEALRTARATDEFIAAGVPDGEVFEPMFTVHGFRYCEVSGLADLDARDLTARVAHSDMAHIGDFSCSDVRLNRLQRNIDWSLRGNFLSVPTDCPQRDERLGWTGDAQVFAATAAFNYDVRSFFRKWMRDVRDAIGVDGSVPHVVPDVLSRELGSTQTGAAGWGDVIALIPLHLWRAFGDRRLVTENIDAAADWLDYLWRHSDRGLRPADGFGDWLAMETTPVDLVSTAYFAICALACIELAEAIGDNRVETFRMRYTQVRTAFRERYVRGGGRLTADTQTAFVLALHAGLFDADERLAAVDRLVSAVRRRNWHLATGFLGTPQLLDVLARHGREDVAYRLLTTETFPSWLFPVVYGDATTMWERWDSWSPSRGFQDPTMTSFNHYAYGAVGAFLYRVLGGLSPLEPGYRRSRIAPRPGGGVTWANTALDTPYGRLACEWKQHDGRIEVAATVPPNTTAEIVLPDGTVTPVGPGRHQLSGAA